tara:strand:+ start:2671 stop:3420 length:750 start_codon:yes stop_codon:yes gene_type:complete
MSKKNKNSISEYRVDFRKNKLIFNYFILYSLLFLLVIISPKKSHPSENSEMDKRSLKSRTSVKEPDFFASRTSSQWIGLYFGVGFRKIRLNVLDDIFVTDSDGEANGIGVNLGYIWEDQGLEFERQTSIIRHNKPLIYKNQQRNLLEVIQNNFWYIRYPKINRYLYLQYGTGIQFTKTRLAGLQSNSSYRNEIAIGFATGVSYYITSNMLLLYRFSLGQQIPLISNKNEKKFLNQSQIHTIYINYYFPF